ncbi:MAG: tRNA (adenosine(37)-N6)-threonylcarbamoyltransferase complex transferase subunit TsaD [Myxococcales bacterium]|nr:tRNA (adenosine(37)-N6)-threonylcarbamoyltransferase complex transferase subunit TsaD [Myxococcales bacterium]
MMRILGIESSCDETAAAVVDELGHVYSDVVRSQVAAHAPYAGVVPEIACRDHLRAVGPVVERALADAGLGLADVDGIAVTRRPGLVGAVLVGVQFAKGLAWALDKPLVGVDHLLGHLLAVFLRYPDEGVPRAAPAFPFVGLLVSGGHTALYRCDGPAPPDVHELGGTRDDAAGEAYDKLAKLLGLGYPGGPVVDRLAHAGDAARAPVSLPAPMAHGLEFSFSGLKSAVARHVARAGKPADEAAAADLCAAVQGALVATLVKKTLAAAAREGVPRVVLAGGVAANRGLRACMREACEARGLELHVPPVRSCTDNAAMIAYAGALRLARGERDGYDIGPERRTELERLTKKGRGPRAQSPTTIIR